MATAQLVGGESAVDDPTDLSRQEYVAAFKRTLAEVKGDDVAGLAAGVAFKMFLSLFPALFAAVAIFSLVTTVGELQEWLAQAEGFLPSDAIALIDKPLTDLATGDGGATGLAAVTGVLAGLWAATSAAVSLMKALSRAYDVPETRKAVRQRTVALLLTVALVVALVGVIVLLVLGPQLQSFLLGDVVAPIAWVLGLGRLVLAFALLVVLFAFVYWIGPNRDHPSWVWMSPGALFGVVAWLIVSGAFTLYAQLGTYGDTYGAIAGVVVLLVWLQLSMLVILVGAELNAEVERTRALHLAVDEGAGFAQPGAVAAVVPDVESGPGALAEARTEAHDVGDTSADAAPPTLPPHPAFTPRPDEGGDDALLAAVPAEARRAAAVIAGLLAIGGVLGFVKRRVRR